MRAFEALMGKQNMLTVLGMDSQGEGTKIEDKGIQSVSVATKQLMADFERGLVSPEQFVSEIQQYCKAGTTKQMIIDAWMSMLAELPAERLAFVDNLRAKGHKTYLLSNGNDLHFDYINAQYHLDSHFDALFLSHKLHLAKPEAQIFETVDKAIHTDGAEVIFIDDIEINRLAAEQYVHWHTFASIY